MFSGYIHSKKSTKDKVQLISSAFSAENFPGLTLPDILNAVVEKLWISSLYFRDLSTNVIITVPDVENMLLSLDQSDFVLPGTPRSRGSRLVNRRESGSSSDNLEYAAHDGNDEEVIFSSPRNSVAYSVRRGMAGGSGLPSVKEEPLLLLDDNGNATTAAYERNVRRRYQQLYRLGGNNSSNQHFSPGSTMLAHVRDERNRDSLKNANAFMLDGSNSSGYGGHSNLQSNGKLVDGFNSMACDLRQQHFSVSYQYDLFRLPEDIVPSARTDQGQRAPRTAGPSAQENRTGNF
jgi:hypothetical protein